jgi:hypothetical protein
MATFSIDDLQKLFNQTKDASLGAFIDELRAMGTTMADSTVIAQRFGDETVKKLTGIQETAKSLLETFGDFSKEAEKMQGAVIGAVENIANSFGDFIQSSDLAVDGLGVLAVQGGLALEPLMSVIPQSIAGLGQLGQVGYDAGSRLTTAFAGVGPMLEKIGGKSAKPFIDMLGAYTEGADRVYSLQRGVVALAAAQGTLSSMVDQSTGQFVDLNRAYMDQTNLAYTSAVATGQTVQSMMELSQTIGSIPGALTESVEAGQNMSQLVATSRLATGFMRSQSEVAKTLADMYTNVGISGQEAFEALANIYEKAGDSKLRFDAFAKTVLEISSNFKMLGDNTRAATEVVRAFDKAFQDSDISPAAMQTVIQSLTAGVQGMDRAKQAFVSGQTGGPGGLAGAFQMEYAMQTGNMDEVLSKTMTAMQSQFGGQVLTLKDAAQNPALAGEFYKQVQYLTQVAGVAKDDREAYRILEAMQSGVMDILTPGAGADEGSKALETSIDRGTAIQEKQTSFLMRIHQDTELLKYMQSDIQRLASEGVTEGFGVADQMRGAAEDSALRGITDIAGEGSGLVSLDREATIASKIDDYMQDPLMRAIFGGLASVGAQMMTPGVDEEGREVGQLDLSRGIGMITGAQAAQQGDVGGLFSMLANSPVGAQLGLTGAGGAGAGPGFDLGMFAPPGTGAGLAPGVQPAPGGGPTGMMLPFGGAEGVGAGGLPPLPIEVTSQPLEITVNFSEPFDQRVRKIVDQRMGAAQRGEVRAGVSGNSN